jgi:hypothetical protein
MIEKLFNHIAENSKDYNYAYGYAWIIIELLIRELELSEKQKNIMEDCVTRELQK